MTFFIAEISSNHNGSLPRALELVDRASEEGFDAVKFQLFGITDLFAQEILDKSEEHRARSKWELPKEFLRPLRKRASELSLGFSVTPFSISAVQESQDFVDFFKVASYELLWEELLVHLAQTHKPVVISSGMANLAEVAHARDILVESGCTDISILHCLSSYPSPPEETNLSAIATLRDALGEKTGWSDHTRNPGVIHRAVHRWGAEIIELHLDLDGKGFEFAPGHCWLPEEAGKVIREIREGQGSDGSGIKEPAPSEIADREWRADPSDGLRPLKHMRAEWKKER